MTRSETLRTEVNRAPSGRFCPNYFRYQGYTADPPAPITSLRANGIAALFTRPEPYIYTADLIAGNTRCLYAEVDRELRHEADRFAAQLGSRSFLTNKDHYSPNYAHVVQVGIPGLLAEIDASLQAHAEDPDRLEMLRAMRITLSAFAEMIGNYAKKAEMLQNDPAYDRESLAFIAQNCTALLSGAPQTFAQGLQLIWFCHIAFSMEERYAMALGRLDQTLYPLYRREIDAGTLTDAQATELLQNVFTKIPTTDVVNICIGGTNPDGSCAVNPLSSCIVAAVKRNNAPGPNLSARITPHTPDAFLQECLESIGTGLGYPALMNDTVNLAALAKIGYDPEDVYDYSMVGCIENFITGKQPPWSDGRFDTPRFLAYVFNNGECPFNGSVGLKTGDLSQFLSMDDFMHAFKAQLSHGVAEYCAAFHAQNTSINQRDYAEPFLSCFCDDCIARGLDINNGGSKYPSIHGAVLMGVGTVADSLAAVEKVVFRDKAASLTELRDALLANFEGYETLRQQLLAAPKYGNNDDFVDKYAVWFLEYLAGLFSAYKTRDGGAIYVAMAANTQNISAGRVIAATPDGRRHGEPLSDAASPTYGRDKRGATITLTSVSKPDYTKAACGTVVNQKFSPAMFSGEKLPKLATLVRTYFKKGGQELQINATSREVLLDAMEHPENYPTLVVRVSGFSDYFVRLPRDVQLDILNRTQHE
ncbi:MAG: hypothetical protein E7452_08625 [Ruminococcaceae bacterium]|nr:hypothetical protein [Oscillospiraceae bacterium]